LRGYQWSTYPGYIGEAKRCDFVTYGPILAEMGGRKGNWPRKYARYVETGLAETDKEFEVLMKESPRSIGGEGFRAWVDELHWKLMGGHKTTEDVSFRRVTRPLDPALVLQVVAGAMNVQEEELHCRRRSSLLRALAARCLIRYAGQTQREVARILGIGSGSAVSKQIERHRAALEDREMALALTKIDQKLQEDRKRSCAKPVKS